MVLMVIYFKKKYHYLAVSVPLGFARTQKFGAGCCGSVCRRARNFVALRLHHAGLRDHPRVLDLRAQAGFGIGAPRDAGSFSARGGAQLSVFHL